MDMILVLAQQLFVTQYTFCTVICNSRLHN